MKKKLLSTIDFIVTGQKFDVVLNLDTEIAKTVPYPKEEKMLNYYRSTKYHSHNKPSKPLISFLYNCVQRLMFKNKLDLIKKYVTVGSRLLDFGSGLGGFPVYANKTYETYAVEPIIYKSNFATKKGIEVKKSIDNYNLKNFDAITFWHSLEHVYNPNNLLETLKKNLKKNTYIFIAVPNLMSYDANKYKYYWAGYDVPRHLNHFSRTGIKKFLENFNFKLIETNPLIFDAFYVSYISETYKKSKFPILNGFYSGLISNIRAIKTKEFSSNIFVFKKN
tara:strand:- start:41661 stop:42494 length:834 start_codon:yes stop_codon:yes gene_type:complete